MSKKSKGTFKEKNEELFLVRVPTKKQMERYTNRVNCGNCHKNVQIRDAETCEICNKLLCGFCGTFCEQHKPKEKRNEVPV